VDIDRGDRRRPDPHSPVCSRPRLSKTADGLPDRAAIEAVLPELRDVFTLLEARLSGGEYLAANGVEQAKPRRAARMLAYALVSEAIASRIQRWPLCP
jgi:glutathione S-transferase